MFDDLSLEALLARGDMLWKQGQEAEAIACCEVATQRAPSSFIAWYKLGARLGWTPGRHEDAITAFEHALSIESHSAHAWEWLASLLEKVERVEEAKHAYEQVLACGNERYPVLEGRAHILHYELERYAEALDAYEQIVQEYPNEVFMYLGMGEALCALGRYEGPLPFLIHFLRATLMMEMHSMIRRSRSTSLSEMKRRFLF